MIKNVFFFCLCCVVFIVCASCKRNATFEDRVVFRGNVYSGSPVSSTTIQQGDLAVDVLVMCEGYSEYTYSDENGFYELSISATRTFNANNSEEYTLSASKSGKYEKKKVSGKPGETLRIENIVLYRSLED